MCVCAYEHTLACRYNGVHASGHEYICVVCHQERTSEHKMSQYALHHFYRNVHSVGENLKLETCLLLPCLSNKL